MMSNEINLEELEALANAAGGVKWIACGPSYGEAKPAFLDEVNVDDDEYPESVCQYPAGCRSDVSDKMAYIAEANPATLLSLLDRLKSAEAERDALVAKLKDAEHDRDEFRRVMNGFAEKMAELEGQKPVQLDEPDYHWEAMGCGLEDRNITDRYEAMKHGWDCAMDRMFEQISEPLYARPVPPEPVNVRLLEALKTLRDALRDHPEYAQLSEEQEEETGGDTAEFSYLVRVADEAIAAAEAQQEQLLQDMHDAGREIDRVMAEPQPDADGPWKSAVIDQLVIAHIITAEHESDPLKAIQDLLAYHADIAVDPRVSGAAATLVEQAKAEEREACAKVCDELFPPPSEQMTVDWAAGTVACANAIRARGQK